MKKWKVRRTGSKNFINDFSYLYIDIMQVSLPVLKNL